MLPAVGGLLAGHLLATAVVAAGVAALVARSSLAMTALTVAGAAYLVWLGAGALAHPPAPHADLEQQPDSSWLRQALRGLGISGLNPKVFLALLPQFTDPAAAWPIAVQITALGLVHVPSCAVVYTGVGDARARRRAVGRALGR